MFVSSCKRGLNWVILEMGFENIFTGKTWIFVTGTGNHGQKMEIGQKCGEKSAKKWDLGKFWARKWDYYPLTLRSSCKLTL